MVATLIHKLLDNVTDISFTTDIWSSDVSQMQTALLMSKLSTLTLRELFAGSHPDTAIARVFDCMFAQWKSKKDHVHVVLSDNGLH